MTSFKPWEDVDTSGHYIFRPNQDTFKPQTYSKFVRAELQAQVITLFYGKDQIEDVIIHISLLADLPVVKYDLDMVSLPQVAMDGYEVVV